MDFNYVLGIDVGKDKLFYCLRNSEKILCEGSVENHYSKLNELFKSFKQTFGFKAVECLVCMEPTGIYNFHLLYYLPNKKIPAWVVPGQQIKSSLGIVRGKSDKVDANRIADYAIRFQDKLELWTPPRSIILKLKSLLVARDRLITAKTMLEVPLQEMKAFVSKEVFDAVKKATFDSIQSIEKSILKTDELIKELINSDPDLKEMYTRITSIKSVGFVTASTFIAETNEFKNFDSAKKLACQAGVIPFANESGKKISIPHVSHKANKKLKTLLDLCACVAIRCEGEFKVYYQRKLLEGKHKMSVRNAVRNKLVLRIFAVVKNKTMYENKYEYKVA